MDRIVPPPSAWPSRSAVGEKHLSSEPIVVLPIPSLQPTRLSSQQLDLLLLPTPLLPTFFTFLCIRLPILPQLGYLLLPHPLLVYLPPTSINLLSQDVRFMLDGSDLIVRTLFPSLIPYPGLAPHRI